MIKTTLASQEALLPEQLRTLVGRSLEVLAGSLCSDDAKTRLDAAGLVLRLYVGSTQATDIAGRGGELEQRVGGRPRKLQSNRHASRSREQQAQGVVIIYDSEEELKEKLSAAQSAGQVVLVCLPDNHRDGARKAEPKNNVAA
jgi:hypothetical protein